MRRPKSPVRAALAAAPLSVAAAPAWAQGAMGAGDALGLAGIAAGAAAVAAAAWAVAAARRRCAVLDAERRAAADRAEAAEAMLASAPTAWARLRPDGRIETGPAVGAPLAVAPREGLAALVGAEAAAEIEAAARGGRPASVDVVAPDGRPLRASTAPLPDGGTAVWVEDRREAARADAAEGQAQAARRSAARFAAMLDALPAPVWLREPDGGLAWVNRAYADAVEADPRQAVEEGRELAPRAGAGLARRAAAADAPQTERHAYVARGERRVADITEMPFGVGERPAQLGFAVDTTEIEDVRAELARHIAGHADVLERVGSAIAIYGPDGRLAFHNQAYVRLSGLDDAYLSTGPAFGDVLEELRIRRRLPEEADFRRFKAEQTGLFTSLIEPQESLLHLPDGTTVRQLAAPHALGGLIFVQEDVTDRLQLESSYNTLLAVQQETLDNLAEGIAVFGGDWRLRLSNPEFRRLWGMGDAAALARGPHLSEILEMMRGQFADDAAWTEFARRITASAADREQASGRIEREDAAVVQYATVPLPDGAIIVGFLDVTDTVRVEQALRRSNAALEAADRLKSEFIANVSYQLRTPLNAIMGFAEILQNGYYGTLTQRQLEYVSGVLESGQRLLILINDILDLATIEAGFMALERTDVDVEKVIQSVAELTRDWAETEQLSVETRVPPGVGTIRADERRIKQAVFNLVSNAIKFTPAGGRITLSAERAGDEVVISVADTGIGIPARDQDRVFGRFERAHPDQRGPGAGLGLSLVKSFVELHGGRVRMESRPDEGTRIDCVLPVAAPEEETRGPEAPPLA
jgi:signal transduction histidine kinase